MSQIDRRDIYDKNLNFLIGSGASVGLLPTLSLDVKDSGTGKTHTLETLGVEFSENPELLALLFSYYVEEVVHPAASFDLAKIDNMDQGAQKAVENYRLFLRSVLMLLEKKPNLKRANVFTTNYDGMIAHVAEDLLRSGAWDFTLNDGGVGFMRRILQTKNFSRYVKDQGVFDRHEKSVPQINLIQPHGSVYWYRQGEQIQIEYNSKVAAKRIDRVPTIADSDFEEMLGDGNYTEADIGAQKYGLDESDVEKFWKTYNALPIVNPTKWKFHETVFEEHYYQALRLLSYELERPNSVFVVFGFSFADEHILNLVKRSLSNPTLKVFICCYSASSKAELETKFEGARNVDFISLDEPLNFTKFNEAVFSVDPAQTEGADGH